MTVRANVWIFAFVLCGCELPESNGPKPTEAALGGGSISKSLSKLPANKTVRPTSTTEVIKPASEPAPALKGEETGALVGLRSEHNDARAKVGVGPLEWSNEIGAYAQEWANHLAANGCQLAHRSNGLYGENLFWRMPATTADVVVASWVAESADYDAANNTCAAQTCGHYTQVIWANTSKLGCGVASCGTAQIWVCNYDPRGNVMGQKPY
jgi:pathogenesis-related protein 1